MARLTIPKEELFESGHMGCQGCGGAYAMRLLLKALGPRTIVSIPACCWAIMSGAYPNQCLKVPNLNTAFEVTGASISGIRAALDIKGKKDINVVGFAGDGGTFDIGIQALSGAVERRENVFYVCYDNEAYMNTGIQRSSSTPVGAWTTTTPVGKNHEWKQTPKKNMIDIMVAHKIPYTAVCNVSYPEDLIKKVKKGLDIEGPKYYQIYAPCPTGWKSQPSKSIELGKLAVDTCIYPIYEVEMGKYKISRKPKNKKPVKDYLKHQGRFRHLTEDMVERIQKQVDGDWMRLLNKEEHCIGYEYDE